MALLAIQRSTPNLPFQLIAPGRTLLKRGTLLRVEREQRLREFLLLSDCLIWLSKGSEREWDWGSRPMTSPGITGSTEPVAFPFNKRRPEVDRHSPRPSPKPSRPSLGPRQRSKSDAELPSWRGSKDSAAAEPTGEEKWWYRGRCDLMDLEVVPSSNPAPGEDKRLDIFGPFESFALYTSTLFLLSIP